MHLSSRALLLFALFAICGVLTQQTAEPTTGTPDVTLPTDGAFVFCSDQDCTGTCQAVNLNSLPDDQGLSLPDGMTFESIYFYNPDNYGWALYTCMAYECASAVAVGDNECYNLYDNGVPTEYLQYYYLLDS